MKATPQLLVLGLGAYIFYSVLQGTHAQVLPESPNSSNAGDLARMSNQTKSQPAVETQDEFFLSSTNPLATRDQRELLKLAVEVFASPTVQQAKAIAARKVKTLVQDRAPAEAWEHFEKAMDEWTFDYVLKAVNADPNYPKVLMNLYAPPHRMFDMDIPGNRAFGGDNPDTLYGIIPVDPYARYEITGNQFSDNADTPIQIASNLSLSSTLSFLASEDIVYAEDGSFTINIGPEPGDGQANYLQSGPDARYVLLRNTRSDWSIIPHVYRVERIDPPTAEPLSIDEVIERAARYIVDDIPASVFWLSMVDELNHNEFTPAFVTGAVGGMWTARMSFARLDIQEDEAIVLTIGSGGARFINVVLMNYWQLSVDYDDYLTSMNDFQSKPNPNGSFTYVICASDPGVHNWINSRGMQFPKIMVRWQQLPRDESAKAPEVTSKIVKLNALAQFLTEYIPETTPEQRSRQLAERKTQYRHRFVDH